MFWISICKELRILSVYRPNKSGFLPKDQKEDYGNYMDIGLWEIKGVQEDITT